MKRSILEGLESQKRPGEDGLTEES
jgi:hypothetical protein